MQVSAEPTIARLLAVAARVVPGLEGAQAPQQAPRLRAELHTQGTAWLAALGLPGESGYLDYRGTGGEERIALDRKVCCLHFRRRDGERRSTCPRRSVADRIACLDLE